MSYLVLKDIWLVSNNKNLYIDIWLLAEGLTQYEIGMLRATEHPRGPHYCCYLPGGPDNQGQLENMMTGFARMIMHSSTNGIEYIKEGHFTKGVQDSWGRVHMMERSYTPQYYSDELHYTGYWATNNNGRGIAVHERINRNAGTYYMDPQFPNGGRTWASPEPYEFGEGDFNSF